MEKLAIIFGKKNVETFVEKLGEIFTKNLRENLEKMCEKNCGKIGEIFFKNFVQQLWKIIVEFCTLVFNYIRIVL